MNQRFAFFTLFLLVLGSCQWSLAAPPAELAPRLQIAQEGVELTLLAEHPEVVTPTGIDVDSSGRVWAVLSHTHFRPDDYDGPEHDEVIVLGSDGSRTVFFNQTDATMDLELEPDFKDGGWVYLAERDRILRVRDRDGDGRGDDQEDLAVLKTEADYPHNGMCGLAWHPSGDLIFALGENYSQPWTMTGRDGVVATGTGEGGVFRCNSDGSSLRRIARGFWNPFGICVREDGTIFASENDPGARPPCRLLHVVEGGDYGYQRHYGNAPFHPFVCWNGELRGTLPMLHSVGEAPCGIAPLANGLVVPSWTDHRIDFYPLTPEGASFTTKRVTLVQGGDHFRPVCITQASANVYYLTDWVFGSYEIHKRGRIWKLEIDRSNAPWLNATNLPPPTDAAIIAERLRDGDPSFSDAQVFTHAHSDDPFIRGAAIHALSRRVNSFSVPDAQNLDRDDRLTLLLAIRRSEPENITWAKFFFESDDAEIQFETLRWIADSRLDSFMPEVQSILADSRIDYRIYEAALATVNTLAGNPEKGVLDAKMLIARVTDAQASPRTRAFALRLLDPQHAQFDHELWSELFDSGDPLLVSELIRALAQLGTPRAKEFLAQVAVDESIGVETRGDAIAGLSASGDSTISLLVQLTESSERTIRDESLRSLRFTDLTAGQRRTVEQVAKRFPQSADLAAAAIDPENVKVGRPKVDDTAAWQQRLAEIRQDIDLHAGWRVFHHASVGTCVKCHRHSGRGSAVGPDLTAATNAGDPQRLLRSILQPSREVDPQYFPRMLVTEDGEVFTGIMLRDGGGGKEFYRDNSGRERIFKTADIVQRKELYTSMMPEGMIDLMTDREIRDLIAFLDADREPDQ